MGAERRGRFLLARGRGLVVGGGGGGADGSGPGLGSLLGSLSPSLRGCRMDSSGGEGGGAQRHQTRPYRETPPPLTRPLP